MRLAFKRNAFGCDYHKVSLATATKDARPDLTIRPNGIVFSVYIASYCLICNFGGL